MKPGFTLIELMIGLMLSSIIGLLLYNSFFYINRSSLIVQNYLDHDTRFNVIQNQLEKDLSGAFVPIRGMIQQPLEKKEEPKPGQQQPPPPEKKEPVKLLEKVFYSMNKGESLSVLTFITSNPVRVYEKAKNSSINPRMVRIVYRLMPDKQEKDSFILSRQEGQSLEFSDYEPNVAKQIPSYELASDIKSMSIEFLVPKESQKETKEIKEQQTFDTLKQWQIDQKEALSKKRPLIPQFVTITIILWDLQHEREYSKTFHYTIATFGAEKESASPQMPSVPPQVQPSISTPEKSQQPGIQQSVDSTTPRTSLFAMVKGT